jgi:hypothetical protein
MPTPPEDIDALFGAPAPSPPPILPGSPAVPSGFDGRKEMRVKVSQWPGRVQLPNGKVVELRVRDLSESGVGLVTEMAIPAYTVLNFAMGVPGLVEPGKITPVSGTIKTTYMVVSGPDLCCGGMWVSLPDDSRDLLAKWIRRLRK